MVSLAIDSRQAPGQWPSGATSEALLHYERALCAFRAWRGGVDELLARAVRAAPAFVMAHATQAWLLLLSRDPRRVRRAAAPYARAMQLPTGSRRERLHLEAIGAVLADDHRRAQDLLDRVLHDDPHDLLALQVAHSLDYLGGDQDQLLDRVARVLPAWAGSTRPGQHALRAMHAFGLVERGDCAAAEREARAALALHPADARAHHVMAHVFDGTGRAADGLRWMAEHAPVWRTSAVVAAHCTWHMALFHLALGEAAQALALYDEGIPAVRSGELADLIDASALLWRMALRGVDVGARWPALAQAWAAHIDDGYCSFSDVHAMLAFVGARDEGRARRLLRALAAAAGRPTRHGRTTRQLGLPACQALAAFGRGDHTLAITLLAGLTATAHGLGGSHAQRDVLHLTLLQAVERLRRPIARTAGTLFARAAGRDAARSAGATLPLRPAT
ncbi:tetratricopeptide repeat protein [Piscinibacter defluvii]|uniref:tetratricopeptide repeat protein n=1 Tax=Piscinibacter defluvii TaxID=1796922 RepID=UPI000FDDFC6D|nr:tetratricopeptide repeat protein [Piscinibacter defluvii]